MLVKSYYKVYKAFPDPDYFYVQNEYAGTNTFTLQKTGTPATTDLAYSKDKSTWTTFDLTQSQNTVSLLQGEKLYFRSTTGLNSGTNNYVSFSVVRITLLVVLLLHFSITKMLRLLILFQISVVIQLFVSLMIILS
jgi:hypothetical protein